MRWRIWDPSNAAVRGLKIKGSNSVVRRLYRMMEGVLTHRAELLAAASPYGSAVPAGWALLLAPGLSEPGSALPYLPRLFPQPHFEHARPALSAAPWAAGTPEIGGRASPASHRLSLAGKTFLRGRSSPAALLPPFSACGTCPQHGAQRKAQPRWEVVIQHQPVLLSQRAALLGWWAAPEPTLTNSTRNISLNDNLQV